MSPAERAGGDRLPLPPRPAAQLENECLRTLRVLFRGKTDARTARALTSQLAQQLIEDIESAPTDNLWQLYRRALAEGQREFRARESPRLPFG